MAFQKGRWGIQPQGRYGMGGCSGFMANNECTGLSVFEGHHQLINQSFFQQIFKTESPQTSQPSCGFHLDCGDFQLEGCATTHEGLMKWLWTFTEDPMASARDVVDGDHVVGVELLLFLFLLFILLVLVLVIIIISISAQDGV